MRCNIADSAEVELDQQGDVGSSQLTVSDLGVGFNLKKGSQTEAGITHAGRLKLERETFPIDSATPL